MQKKPPQRTFKVHGKISTATAVALETFVTTKVPNNSHLVLDISSYGGDAKATARLRMAVRAAQQRGVTVTTYGSGMICSGALLLFVLGDTRVLTKEAGIMVHLPEKVEIPTIVLGSDDGEENLQRLLQEHEQIKKSRRLCAQAIAARSRLSTRKVKALENKFVTAAQALQYGLCDKII